MQTPTCGELPFDMLRANGKRAHAPGLCSPFLQMPLFTLRHHLCSGRTGNEHMYRGSADASVHPSTGSGRTETSTCGLRRSLCSPFDRLRANGIRALVPGSADSVHPSTGSGRTEYEHLYRAPRTQYRGSADASVHPSTGSGRTEYEHLYRAPQMPLFTLRQAQGERNTSTCSGLRRCLCFRQAQGERETSTCAGLLQMPLFTLRRSGRTVE